MKNNLILDYNKEGIVLDLDPSILDDNIRSQTIKCINAQKKAATEAIKNYQPIPNALELVSENALNEIIKNDKDVHGIASDRSISNVICFGAKHISDSVLDEEVSQLREQVDHGMQDIMASLFPNKRGLSVSRSGYFWYPKGCYMGWHTNSAVPGWRVYINYAEEENKSFFRYKDPINSQIVTLSDQQWNVRLFKISDKTPIWHSVYSDTNRFSLGYMVSETSLISRVKGKMKRILGSNN